MCITQCGAKAVAQKGKHYRGKQDARLVGVEPGMEVELSRELVVSVLETKHTIPSLGFLVWERRKKLLPEYLDLSGPEIRDLRLSGVEVTREIRLPRLCYLGDTNPVGLDANPDAFEAEVLILEMTFVARGERPDRIHKFGRKHAYNRPEDGSIVKMIYAKLNRYLMDWFVFCI